MKEVVILGAGFGGLKALHKLQQAKDKFHITLVDQHAYHCETINLEEVATGESSAQKITFSIKHVINPKKTTFIQAKVVRINHSQHLVEFKQRAPISYDYLIIALGFHAETFGITGARDNSLQMDSLDTALRIKQHIFNEMQLYRTDHQPDHLKIIVCGAGFTGVELLGSLNDMRKAYAKIAGVDPQQIELSCIDHSATFLPMFSRSLANYGWQWLRKWGIQFYTQCGITAVEPGEVKYTDQNGTNGTLTAGTIIWTTGVSGSQVIAASNYAQHRGRVHVNQDMSAPNDEQVYIIGDVAAFFPPDAKRPYPTTAQIALQMGACAARNILHALHGEATEQFIYHTRGTVASIGKTKSFGIAYGVPVKGYIGSVTKKMIDDLALYETGGMRELVAKGKFDFYH